MPTVDAGVRCVAYPCPPDGARCGNSSDCEDRYGPGAFCRERDDGACCGRRVCVRACRSAPYVVVRPTDVAGARFPPADAANQPIWWVIPTQGVVASGYGFPPGTEVRAWWSDGEPLGSFAVDRSGGFEGTFVVPRDAFQGTHAVAFTGEDGVGATAELAVIAALGIPRPDDAPRPLTEDEQILLDQIADCGLTFVGGGADELGEAAGFMHKLRQGRFVEALLEWVPLSSLPDCVAVGIKVGIVPWPRPPVPEPSLPRVDVVPGGMWIEPTDGEVLAGPRLRFAAHAYPTRPTDPSIARVEFTVWWPGVGPRDGPWLVACSVDQPEQDDIYACETDLALLGAPPGEITVSFDVYDVEGGRNLAPHGLRTVRWRPEEGCPAGRIRCDGECVDPRRNAGHCGACGNRCGLVQICCDGVCGCDGSVIVPGWCMDAAVIC